MPVVIMCEPSNPARCYATWRRPGTGQMQTFFRNIDVMRTLGLCFLLLSPLAVSAAPASLCWTDKVELFGNELRIFPTLDYVPRVSIKRKGTENFERYEPDSNRKYFALHEGDIAYLSGGPHDNCKATAESRTSGLGVQFEAAFRPPGLPPDFRTEFVLATKSAND